MIPNCLLFEGWEQVAKKYLLEQGQTLTLNYVYDLRKFYPEVFSSLLVTLYEHNPNRGGTL